MNTKNMFRALASCGLLILLFVSACSIEAPTTYACKYPGLGEVGLQCVSHQMSPEMSVYKARRNGSDVMGVVALPPKLFSRDSYGVKEDGGRLHLFRQASEMFAEMGCYGNPTSTIMVDKENWQITECGLGTYVRGNIFGKGEFGIYVRRGADVGKSIVRVAGFARSGGSPMLFM